MRELNCTNLMLNRFYFETFENLMMKENTNTKTAFFCHFSVAFLKKHGS